MRLCIVHEPKLRTRSLSKLKNCLVVTGNKYWKKMIAIRDNSKCQNVLSLKEKAKDSKFE